MPSNPLEFCTYVDNEGKVKFLIDFIPQVIAAYEMELRRNLDGNYPGAVYNAMETALTKHILAPVLAAQAATDQPVKLPKEIGIGGNHLASALLSEGIYPASERHTTYDDFLKRYGQPWADIFIAWKAIMDWRDGNLERETVTLDIAEQDRAAYKLLDGYWAHPKTELYGESANIVTFQMAVRMLESLLEDYEIRRRS